MPPLRLSNNVETERSGNKEQRQNKYWMTWIDTIDISSPNPIFDTRGNDYVLTSGRINIFLHSRSEIYNGSITSATGTLVIGALIDMTETLYIESVIQNYTREVGIEINSTVQTTIIGFTGSRANTFSGKSTIRGHKVELNLMKANGVTSISGDLAIRNGALLKTHFKNQFARHSIVTLDSFSDSASTLRFVSVHYGQRDLQENIHALVVEGDGIIDFGMEDTRGSHGSRYFYMDDLQITLGSNLQILAWEEGRDHLLVRKDSAHLEKSLKRLEFEGYNPGNIHLNDFNKDYWEISGTPEPAAYGAGLAAVGLGITALRNRKKRTAKTTR